MPGRLFQQPPEVLIPLSIPALTTTTKSLLGVPLTRSNVMAVSLEELQLPPLAHSKFAYSNVTPSM